MKCPKCGYNSFDHLESCKKCGGDLADHKGKFGLRSLLFPGKEKAETADPVDPAAPEAAPEGATDFGFDFMNEEAGAADTEESALEDLLGEASDEPAGAPLPEEPQHAVFDLGPEHPEEPTHRPAPAPVPPQAPEDLPFDEGDDLSPFGGGAEGSLDFDLSWDEEASLPEPDELQEPSNAGGDPLDDRTSGREEETEGARKSPEKPDRKDPSDPFDAGGDDRDIVSPRAENPAGEDHGASPLSDEDPSPDLASLFLDSLDGQADAPSDPFGSDDDPLPALASGADSAPGGLPPASFDFGVVEPSPASDRAPDGDSPEEEQAGEEDPASPGDSGTEPHPAVESPPASLRAGVGARVGAGAADLLLLLLIFALFLTAGELALAPGEEAGILPSIGVLAELAIPYFLVLFALSFGYFTLFHFLTGQTPGKMLFGLRVETEEGADLLLSQAFLRSVGGLLSILPAGLGYLRIVFDPQRRGWNDRLAGSRVVPIQAMAPEADA